MATKPTERCPTSGLTKSQILELLSLLGHRYSGKEGVEKSLRIRGLLSADAQDITPEGFKALSQCSFLTPEFRKWLARNGNAEEEE